MNTETAIPTRNNFRSDRETLAWFCNDKPADGLGRRLLAAVNIDTEHPDRPVRGAVYRVNVAEFVARCEREGYPVRFL